MTETDVLKLIQKHGKERDKKADVVGTKQIYAVPCQGCGKDIPGNTEEPVGCVLTKRGTFFAWHLACEDKVWNSRIR